MLPMKFTYLFGIILASSALALFSPPRGLRTVTAGQWVAGEADGGR